MRRDWTKSLRDVWLLIVSVTLIIFAAVGFYLLYTSASMGNSKTRYSPVGERIYYAGRGSDGKYISYSDGPRWLSSLRDRGCVNCHGEDGRGGYPLMMTSAVAPDITYASLTSAEHHHDEDDGSHGHEEQYTDETIKQAITQGIEPSGERMSVIMPRWEMTDEELNGLITYLKKL